MNNMASKRALRCALVLTPRCLRALISLIIALFVTRQYRSTRGEHVAHHIEKFFEVNLSVAIHIYFSDYILNLLHINFFFEVIST